ncbi:hypothetical protein WEI85_31670 [Actinomycetes bacterium KLBMP 9797]
MDLYSRCVICELRLTPVSTKAVDVAGSLYELYAVYGPSDRYRGGAGVMQLGPISPEVARLLATVLAHAAGEGPTRAAAGHADGRAA